MGINEGIDVFYPKQEFCTDNGAMIALVASIKFNQKDLCNNFEISIKPRWSLEELNV
jgi:N6-L-threonylcarbamoyladenine synthase